MVDACFDTRDLDQSRQFVYTHVRFTGDNKPQERRVAVSETYSEAQEDLERAFDRRLSVAFVDPATNQIHALSKKVWDTAYLAIHPDERLLLVRPLFPGLSVRSPSKLRTSRPSTPSTRPQSSSQQVRLNSPTEQRPALSPSAQGDLVNRLYDNCALSKTRKAIALAEKYYPTASPVRVTPEAVDGIVTRLADDKGARKKADVSRVVEKMKLAGVIAEPKVRRCADREEEEEHFRRFYYGAMKRQKEKQGALNEKLSFQPQRNFPHLKNKDDLNLWLQHMNRDIKQKFRLKDQFF